MAIQLNQRRRLKTPIWLIVSSSAIALALLLSAASYIYFIWANNRASERVSQLEASALSLSQSIAEKEDELAIVQRKVSDFNGLLSKHKNLVNVFKFLEGKIMPDIRLVSFDFNQIGESLVIIDGEAPNFVAVGQQVEVFKKSEPIKSLGLTDISINDEGKLSFTVKLIFEPDFFLYNNQI